MRQNYMIVLIATGFTENDNVIGICRSLTTSPDVIVGPAKDAEGAVYSVNGNVITAGGSFYQMSYQEAGNEYRYVIWG